MSAGKVLYVCRECKHASAIPTKICVSCGAQSAFLPTKKIVIPKFRSRSLIEIRKETPLNEERISSSLTKINTLLNGGFVLGSVTLLAGEPGVGKSTLALQLFAHALYVSGEETLAQIGLRAERLALSEHLRFMSESAITEAIREVQACELPVLIVDSIQTMHAEEPNDAGSMLEIKACALDLIEYAKQSGCVVLIVGHITKDGSIAGPETLMHLVDTVMQFSSHESADGARTLRVLKNRFGASYISEQFLMTAAGLV